MSGLPNMSTIISTERRCIDEVGFENLTVKNLNINEPNVDKLNVNKTAASKTLSSIKTDVLIIGSGLAGLSTALALPKYLSITILSKAALETCSSHYAQGGIAASLDKDDSIADHVSDTLIAGAGLCATDNTNTILSAGQQAVQWLCAQGVPFTQIPQENTIDNINTLSELKTADLHLTKEGGHGCRRVAHADDATGRHIMQTLTIKAQAANNITILPFHEALTLLTSSADNCLFNSTNNRYCQGAVVFDHNTQRQLTFHSRAVVLASGGLGQLFQRATAPNVCVGDGIMMAWQAGCRLANLEFIQFHPTGLALGISNFLVSEALRGEGGRLYCPLTGARFMLDIDTRAELAPRDIVARAIAEQIKKNGLDYVHLDVSHLSAEFLRSHFPDIYQTLLELGIDITIDPIPVAPTAHYSCGGIVTCAKGLTDVQGLYAAGEVAYTGLHGANRLASNSLLECVVVGRNIANDIPRYLKASTALASTTIDSSAAMNTHAWTAPMILNIQRISLPSPTSHKNNHAYHNLNIDTDCECIATKLKALMSSNMGITRSAEQLEQALIQIQQWQQWLEKIKLSQFNIAIPDNAITAEKLAHFQLARQLQLATLIVQSAYQRLESRGGHYRTDYPHLATTSRISVIEPLSNLQEDSIDALVQPIIKHTEARTAQAVANV